MKSYNTKIIKNAFKRMVEEHGPEVFDVAGEPETLVDYLPDDAKYNVVRMAFRMGCYRRLQELKKQYGRFELAQNPLNTELKSFLLSFSEVCELFPGERVGEDFSWATITPGCHLSDCGRVESKECIMTAYGGNDEVYWKWINICPAMWITLDGN